MKSDQTLPNFDLTSFLLFMVMIWISSWALTAADWADHLTLVTTVASLGVVAGTALARSRFTPRLAFLFATVYAIFTVGWQAALTLDVGMIWRDRILAILGRVGTFLYVIMNSEPNRDPLMFVIVMAVLFWIFGSLGAWTLFRRGTLWAAILPSGIAVLVNAYFHLGDAPLNIYLAVFLFLALLLFVRSDMNQRQMTWEALHARVPVETGSRINRVGVIAAALMIAVSWVGPSFSRYENLAQLWGAVTSPFQSARDWLGDALGGLRGPMPIGPEVYGDELTLEAGVLPEDISIMDVDPERIPTGSGRFYWRSKVYDQYEDGSWTSTVTTFSQFDPDEGDIPLTNYAGREVIEVTVTPRIGALASLYLPSQPIWVNRSANIVATYSEDELVDIASMTARQAVMRGEPYRARASVASPSGSQLRGAGSAYPDWVLERYLQISPSITPRTIVLAHRITEGYDTPYDKAVAITSWLRQNIEYNRETDAPPEGAEPLDWFLFDYQVGFCNYYASAQVVMLRVVGIPARIAAGYARGEYDSSKGVYNVSAEDSHSWPEVYFPGFGWVEFEPTVSQDALNRPEPLTEEERDEQGGGGESDFEGISDIDRLDRIEDMLNPEEGIPDPALPPRRSILGRLLAGLAAAVVLLVLWMRIDPSSWLAARRTLARRLTRLGVQPPSALLPLQDEPSVTGRIYRRWTIWLRRLGAPLHMAQTPYERATAFATMLPDSATEGWTIVNAYAQERYGQVSVDEDNVRHAWRKLSPQMLLAWVWRITERFRESTESS